MREESWVLCVLGKWKGLPFLLEDEEAAIRPLGNLKAGFKGQDLVKEDMWLRFDHKDGWE
jgi:hypothetical protein